MTNIGMADMSGWDLAERIREHDPQVPLIFITGWGLQEQDQARSPGPRSLLAALQARAARRAAQLGAERARARPGRRERDYTRSMMVAIPCPKPMHMV